ncbi:hypothetical protein PVK73_24355 [Bacillus thuringiensis]
MKHEKSLASVLTFAAASLPVTTLTADYSDHVTKNGEKDWMVDGVNQLLVHANLGSGRFMLPSGDKRTPFEVIEARK